MFASAILGGEPLADLLHAAIRLLADWGRDAERTITWWGEPEEWDVVIAPASEDLVDIRVTHRDNERARARSQAVVLNCRLGRFEFAQDVLRQADRLLRRWGEDGYTQEWRSPFPRDLVQRLRTALT